MSMTKIQQVTVGAGGAANIEFTGIPALYDDIVIRLSGRSTGSPLDISMNFNGNTSSYSHRYLYAAGSGSPVSLANYLGTDKIFLGTITPNAWTSNTFGNTEIYISSYRSSNSKSVSVDSVSEANQTEAYQFLTAGLWNNTEAINTVTLNVINGTWGAGSSATLYGINRTQAIGRPKAIGGNITFANGHWVHTFTGSGTFVVQDDLQAEAVIVAGGGGGGGDRVGGAQCTGAGGGGAGGLRYVTGINMSAGSIAPITVGAGGVGGTGDLTSALNGSNSTFGQITSIGGGFGANRLGSGNVVGSGGSGGGAGAPGASFGTGTSGQGFDGGVAAWSSNSFGNGGGGGGSAAVGVSATSSVAGNGGAGTVLGITGTMLALAGGGGGGSGRHTRGLGQAGGGDGGTGDGNGSSAAANTGSGGGGASANGNGAQNLGGNGGSGIVIIRYPA